MGDLPNFAIPEVEVDIFHQKIKTGKVTSLYTVQFTDSSNSGKQNTLLCNIIHDPSLDGAQPKYTKVDLCRTTTSAALNGLPKVAKPSLWTWKRTDSPTI